MRTKNNFNYKQLQSKVIRKELLINGGDLDLYLDVIVKDKNGNIKQTLSKKADSILANFMRILYLQMCRDPRDNVMGGTFYSYDHSFNGTQLSSISSGNNGVFRLNANSSIFLNYPLNGKITLSGFQGINLEGRYDFTKISDYSIDIENTIYTNGWVMGTGGGASHFPRTNIGHPSWVSFQNAGIIVGIGDAPVSIDDYMLHKYVANGSNDGQLTYGNTIVSQDTNDSISAQITITRTFTNNSSITIPIKEIGYLQKAGTSEAILLTMRDVLPTAINVASGNTLTVNYRIKTVLGTGTDPGGFVASFMRLLYRHIASDYRAVFDINNNSQTKKANHPTFCVIRHGGNNIQSSTNGETEYGYKFGIVVGRGTSTVSMGDYYLETPIEHGNGINQMLYYGGFGEGFTVGSDYAEFNIYKAIENNSGNTIQINEYALIGGAGVENNGNFDSEITNLYMLTRNVLTNPINVLNQQILKVIYTLRCVLNPLN